MTRTNRHRPAPRRPRAFTHADRWAAALDDFTHTMTGTLAASTVARVAKHAQRFAADTGTTPYDVTGPQLAAWLDALDCSEPARYAYRTSLRTFYRWAHRAGRVLDDPTRRDGPHPLARAVPDTWADTLAAFRRWQRAAGIARTTQDLYGHRLAALARETGAPTPWDLDTDDLADWLARHRWARETTRSTRTALRAFYGWAYDLGHTDTNPAEHLPRVRATTPTPRPATETALTAALDAATPDVALMVRLAADLGMRRAEVAQVHARDLTQDDAGRWWLTVHGKGDKLRHLPLPHDLASLLRQRPAGYAFPGAHGGHTTPATVGAKVSAVLPPGVTMHQLRHRFATRAYAVDRDVFTVQRLLGHARADTTQRYVATTDDAMQRLVDMVGRPHLP